MENDLIESLIFIPGSFRADHYNPRRAAMHGVVRGGDLGVIENPVLITMSDTADGNRLIQDLIFGSDTFEVPACEAGAVIELKGCLFLAEDEIEIRAFSVITPRATTGNDLPEPPEGFVRRCFETSLSCG